MVRRMDAMRGVILRGFRRILCDIPKIELSYRSQARADLRSPVRACMFFKRAERRANPRIALPCGYFSAFHRTIGADALLLLHPSVQNFTFSAPASWTWALRQLRPAPWPPPFRGPPTPASWTAWFLL